MWLTGTAVLAVLQGSALWAREVVDAAPPSDLAVTIYRDPDRGLDQPLNRNDPRGLAMISETRRVTLPAGESTIRFEGVAEGMIGVSAIVTGLPGGTIEQNRNAQLLSPAALVDGTLGNRVTITRTNPATGAPASETAIVRTRADGGLVLQTSQGFEAVRCSGLSESLRFNRIPAGLSSAPVFSLNTRSAQGGTYDVTLTYLAWGFDWQADYVASLGQQGRGEEFELGLLSWLTLLNDNGQSFNDARLQIIAGRLNVESDYRALADPPVAEGLYLTCYPLGSTADGMSEPTFPPPPPAYAPAPPMMAMEADAIRVTGMARRAAAPASAVVTSSEEDLGDLKLFRVPGRVDVAAKGMKQVAFLDKDAVKARYLYQTTCAANVRTGFDGTPQPASLLLVTKNDDAKGLGVALPQGAMTVYEPTARGPQVAAKANVRDYARGQDVELGLGASAQVFAQCDPAEPTPDPARWMPMRAQITNANAHPIRLRLQLGRAGVYAIRFPEHRLTTVNGWQVVELTVPAGSTLEFAWQARSATRP